jgi:hypothetical protein
MILLIEPNRKIRKRICDLLNRERIIAVGTYPETLEMIAKFQKRLNIIISNIRVLDDVLRRQTLFRLCEKLYIDIPPILAIHRKGDAKIKEKFEEEYKECKLIKYDGDDNSFPERYIAAVKDLYPEVIADIDKANESWLRVDELEAAADPREWLVKEGFVDAFESSKYGKIARELEQMLPLIKKVLATIESEKKTVPKTEQVKANQKKHYSELREKLNSFVKYIKELDDKARNR